MGSPQEKEKKQEPTLRREKELPYEHSRSQDGIEILREGHAAVLKRTLRFCMRGRVRSGEGDLAGSSSPRGLSDGPGVARAGAPMPPPRSPPEGYPTLPGTKEMPVLPLIFDTIPGLGAT